MPQESGEIAKGNIAPFGKYAAAPRERRNLRATDTAPSTRFLRRTHRESVTETNPKEEITPKRTRRFSVNNALYIIVDTHEAIIKFVLIQFRLSLSLYRTSKS